ncbi:winged helix DNA-binding domain-containing protein [Streptomyces sp. DSM 40750]|uniref:winged helix DNA-binding domain-containing protein n=1 Tax=Streptomyces sp. DSM 40750 TaxID=2801030 RepID=UPI00214BF700|nr:winged helix DNA-binding domain-containing protein [Streptomyces sp. DSM 40750]UUU25905.1 winged helix DNA-binding domain-containing protein [Streptomyces sp. DSM 40750]
MANKATANKATANKATANKATANKATRTAPRIGTRALNRATLARQFLLHRAPVSAETEPVGGPATPAGSAAGPATPTRSAAGSTTPPMSAYDAVQHLLGLQAQNVQPPYYALAARLDRFAPEQLSTLMADRAVVRIVTMRSTIHTHTADDCLTLRPLVQPARERELHQFRKGLVGVDLDRLAAVARELVEAEPRTLKQLREALLVEWPDADPFALGIAARCRLPLVQVTPRGLWGRSGQVALTTAEHWLGRPAEPAPPPETVVRRYLAAFGPASVKDMQTWAGLTRLREAFEGLRPELLTFRDDSGVELFDLPDAPRPDPATPAPPRLLPEFDNLLLSHADRSRVVPPDLKGRSWKGNQAYRTFLVDGFLAGIWKLEGDALTLEPFGRLTPGQREGLLQEAERTLTVLHGDGSYDIRFGTVAP